MSEITTTVNPPVVRSGLVVWRRALLNLFTVVTGAYGLNVSSFLVLHYAIGEQWTLIGWFNSFMHLLVVPAVVLFPLALLLRRWIAIGLLALPLLVCLSIYVPPFFPRPALTAPETAPQLTLLTYNLKSQAVDFDPLTRVIQEADADIVALQELSTAAAAYLDTEFADEYPYRALHSLEGEPIPGQGVLSRYPITSDAYWRINLGHQRVTLDVVGQTVTLYNVHPIQPLVPNGFALRKAEFTDVMNRTQTETGPLLIAGDFNMSDQSDLYREITALYSDTYREGATGMGFTFPAGIPPFWTLSDSVRFRILPMARLDYVFHDAAFQPLAARVWPESGGSDHRPVWVSLALVGE